jgi:NADH-ubiquinone oxidoreductase chain 4
LGIVLTFLVKFPRFLLHIWLPKAHVESPVMGSIILAGILLKLGGFGLFIFHKFLLFRRSLRQGLIVSYVLWGAIFLGLFCYRQKDTKILIALSRVNHIALVITGLFLTYSFTFLGRLLIIIGHGLFSSGLFFF